MTPEPGPTDGSVVLSAAQGVIFDVDGVLTSTAAIHRRAWTALFDELFVGTDANPFTLTDYQGLVDGRARRDGLVAVLEDRKPIFDDLDPTAIERLATRKQELFLAMLESGGLMAFPDAERCLDWLEQEQVRTAAVSASRNATRVLESVGLASRLEFLVDGVYAQKRNLAGKPAPDTFLEAARLLELDPRRCAVVEDAVSGALAARAGGFGLVVGIDRTGVGRPDLDRSADVVLTSLDDLTSHVASAR